MYNKGTRTCAFYRGQIAGTTFCPIRAPLTCLYLCCVMYCSLLRFLELRLPIKVNPIPVGDQTYCAQMTFPAKLNPFAVKFYISNFKGGYIETNKRQHNQFEVLLASYLCAFTVVMHICRGSKYLQFQICISVSESQFDKQSSAEWKGNSKSSEKWKELIAKIARWGRCIKIVLVWLDHCTAENQFG